MAYTEVDFPDLPWTAGNHPLERKQVAPTSPLAMLEFAPGFVDPNWCERSHVILVLRGVLEFELKDGVRRLERGKACIIDAGTAHRARNAADEPVLAFIASETEVRR